MKHLILIVFAVLLIGAAGCEEPPPLPKTGELDKELQENLSQTRDAAASTIEEIESLNQDAKKRLAPVEQDAGSDASD